MLKIGVLISGGGSNLQAILDSIESGNLNCSVEMVISDREGVYGLERAKARGIRTYAFPREVYGRAVSDEIFKVVKGKIEVLVLAGFLSILKGEILTEFKDRIINIHPSLMPAFCGKGMYGVKVHQAAVKSGVKYSGCTVHLVDEGTDTGAIISQKVVPVLPGDSPEELQKRVLAEEHKLLPQVIELIEKRNILIADGKVTYIGEGEEYA